MYTQTQTQNTNTNTEHKHWCKHTSGQGLRDSVGKREGILSTENLDIKFL